MPPNNSASSSWLSTLFVTEGSAPGQRASAITGGGSGTLTANYTGTTTPNTTTTVINPEGVGQVCFPLGLWAGEYNDPAALSYFGSTKVRIDGGRGIASSRYTGGVDIVRDGILTPNDNTNIAHTYALPSDPIFGSLTEVFVKVIAKDLSVTSPNMAVFHLRGSWFNKNGSVTVVGAPEVVVGEPTDSTHCTSGATGYLAWLELVGATVQVKVQNGGQQTLWYIFREAFEGTRSP